MIGGPGAHTPRVYLTRNLTTNHTNHANKMEILDEKLVFFVWLVVIKSLKYTPMGAHTPRFFIIRRSDIRCSGPAPGGLCGCGK
jgi:hypothetical protein